MTADGVDRFAARERCLASVVLPCSPWCAKASRGISSINGSRPGARFAFPAHEIGVNPDQRIHEDARHLVDLSTDLGIGLLQATILLGCFISVLWSLSESVNFSIGGLSFTSRRDSCANRSS